MGAVTKLDVKHHLLTRSKALGNSSRGLREVASDLINHHGLKGRQLQQLADGTFLCPATLQRLAELKDTEGGDPYRPQCDTVERVLRYFGAELHFSQVAIVARYQNRPKSE